MKQLILLYLNHLNFYTRLVHTFQKFFFVVAYLVCQSFYKLHVIVISFWVKFECSQNLLTQYF